VGPELTGLATTRFERAPVRRPKSMGTPAAPRPAQVGLDSRSNAMGGTEHPTRSPGTLIDGAGSVDKLATFSDVEIARINEWWHRGLMASEHVDGLIAWQHNDGVTARWSDSMMALCTAASISLPKTSPGRIRSGLRAPRHHGAGTSRANAQPRS
jgi:hypothetical protein